MITTDQLAQNGQPDATPDLSDCGGNESSRLRASIKRIGRLVMWGLCLTVLLWKCEDWHGEKVWRETQEAMARDGLSFSELDAAAVPAERDNFAMHSIFAPAKQSPNEQPITLQNPPQWDFGKLTQEYANRFRLPDYVAGINDAAKRPYKQWFPYEVPAGKRDYMLERPLPRFLGLADFAYQISLQLAAQARDQLAHERTADALQTLLALIHTIDIAAGDESASKAYGVAHGLLSTAVAQAAMPQLVSSLTDPNWHADELEILAIELGKVDHSQVPVRALRREMLYQLATLTQCMDGWQWESRGPVMDVVRSALAAGWFKHNLAALYQEQSQFLIRPATQDGATPADLTQKRGLTPHNILASVATPGVGDFVTDARTVQLSRDTLRLRCLVQREQILSGNAVRTLNVLTREPHLLGAIPVDHNTGRMLTLESVLQ